MVLYLTRNGLLEPLGQSQVIPYLRGLSISYRITLVTYEKPSDWSDPVRRRLALDECKRLGIRWLPQRFHSHPKLISAFFSVVYLVWFLTREVRREGVTLIHARSYIPAFAASIVGTLKGVPFIFDMRALWPEELITSGRLRRDSFLHRAIVASERVCMARAACVISLTNVGVEYLRNLYPDELANKSIGVIPTCADLARFVPARLPPSRRVIGCLGTLLSGWFRIDWLRAFFVTAAKRDPRLHFEITTHDDVNRVWNAIGGVGDLQSRLSISASPPELVPLVLQGQIASVMFYAGGEISELGRSPTRLAEILGSGLPVVTNDGVGDVAQIVRTYRVGVVVANLTEAEMNRGWDELQELLADPELQARCRRVAESFFSLEAGTRAYSKIYGEILTVDSSRMMYP